ncbi:FAD-binding protein [Neotabrizicola sp. VNH66]|uniref:FAD-binding protein n=1 Tax=Neotabrizicola sp. VNH66 TaxID=3400918 RepID=UPI003C047AF9
MRPADEAELSEAIRTAAGPLSVRGGGTRGVFGPGAVLETGGLSGVRLYEPEALTLVCGAGTRLAEIEALLAGERQRLAFEVPDLRSVLGREGVSTIGGVAAANASGPRRVQAGACRDAMLGVRFVDGAGTVVKNGGRVMKNVTGYDLVKLMAGSAGVLGVLSEVSLKVQARPEAEATLLAEGLGDAAALAVLRRALGLPYDISGAACRAGAALIRVEGMAGSVRYRLGELQRMIPAPWQVVEGEASTALWRAVRDISDFADETGALWRLSVVPGEAEVVPAALRAAGIAHRALWDWGGGLLWLSCAEGHGATIRAALAGRGHATRLRGAETAPAYEPQAPEVVALQAGLKARFDPRGILNPGGLC